MTLSEFFESIPIGDMDWKTESPLFKNRTPEAAARQLAIVLASATEWHLATLEQLRERKSTSKSDLSRQQQICTNLVTHCNDLGVEPRGLRGEKCGRLEDALASLNLTC